MESLYLDLTFLFDKQMPCCHLCYIWHSYLVGSRRLCVCVCVRRHCAAILCMSKRFIQVNAFGGTDSGEYRNFWTMNTKPCILGRVHFTVSISMVRSQNIVLSVTVLHLVVNAHKHNFCTQYDNQTSAVLTQCPCPASRCQCIQYTSVYLFDVIDDDVGIKSVSFSSAHHSTWRVYTVRTNTLAHSATILCWAR